VSQLVEANSGFGFKCCFHPATIKSTSDKKLQKGLFIYPELNRNLSGSNADFTSLSKWTLWTRSSRKTEQVNFCTQSGR
jgi:hypothetical protein